jgi:hypothetical protein
MLRHAGVWLFQTFFSIQVGESVVARPSGMKHFVFWSSFFSAFAQASA